MGERCETSTAVSADPESFPRQTRPAGAATGALRSGVARTAPGRRRRSLAKSRSGGRSRACSRCSRPARPGSRVRSSRSSCDPSFPAAARTRRRTIAQRCGRSHRCQPERELAHRRPSAPQRTDDAVHGQCGVIPQGDRRTGRVDLWHAGRREHHDRDDQSRQRRHDPATNGADHHACGSPKSRSHVVGAMSGDSDRSTRQRVFSAACRSPECCHLSRCCFQQRLPTGSGCDRIDVVAPACRHHGLPWPPRRGPRESGPPPLATNLATTREAASPPQP